MSYLSKSFNVLIVIPLLIKTNDSNDIAFWYLILNIVNIQLLLEAGFSNAFVRMFSYGMTGNRGVLTKEILDKNSFSDSNIDKDFIVSIFEVMKRFYYKIALILMLVFGIIGFWFFKIPIQNCSNPTFGWYIWILTLICFPIIIYGGIFSNVLQGINKIPTLRVWETMFNLISSLSAILILLYYPSVFLLVISMLFWIVVSVLRNRLLCRKLSKTYFGNVDKSILKHIRENAILNALKSGFGVFFAQGITYIIGFYYAIYIPSNDLASYLLAINLILNIRNFSQAPFYSKIPQFTMLSAASDYEGLIKNAQRSMRMVYVLFLVFSILVWILGDYMLLLLNKKNAFPNVEVWSFLVFGFFIERFGAMHIQLYSTSNHILWHIQNGMTGIIVVIFTYFLFDRFAVLSYPIALIVGNTLFYSWYGPWKSYGMLKTSFWKFDKFVFFPFLILSILLLIFVNT